MKKLFLFTSLVAALPAAAAAEESRVVEACKAAVTHYLMKEAQPVTVQDFTELDPPRVRMTVPPVVDMGIGDIRVECEFVSASSPVGLSKFCTTSCVEGARFDEIVYLLEQGGF